MALKTMRICEKCRAKHDERSRYCKECQGNRAQSVSTKQRDAIYGTARWQKLREVAIKRQPLCSACLALGLVVPAEVIDHIVEIRDGGAPYSLDNLQSLCCKCHARKTTKMQGQRRRGEV